MRSLHDRKKRARRITARKYRGHVAKHMDEYLRRLYHLAYGAHYRRMIRQECTLWAGLSAELSQPPQPSWSGHSVVWDLR